MVICTKNSSASIARTLESVVKNRPCEIIIIDGNSSDDTVEIAMRYTQRVYSDGGRGLGYARQLGAEMAVGEYVAYLGSDTELPDENTLSRMVKELKENGWAAIHAQLIDPRVNKTYWEEAEDFHWKNHFDIIGERRYIGTSVGIIRKDLILEYGFDPLFVGAAEDADFYHRIGSKGYKIGVSSVTAYHYHRATLEGFVRQRVWYGKGNARALVKHKAFGLLGAPFGIAFYGILLSAKNRSVKFIPYYITWGVALMAGTLLGLFELFVNCIVKKRHHSQFCSICSRDR